ncbi:MAG: DUF1343 domain-containing protein [Flavobacteriaceae bacterium]|nr:DUF1343 domain-containing protein [Flavobacteriaceae bacterium]
MNFIKNTVLFLAILGSFMGACSQTPKELLTAAQQTEQYLSFLKGKKVGFVGNHNSIIESPVGYRHMVDSLVQLGINITKVFGPEHGFRGNAPDGEIIQDGKDLKTGIPIVSLYWKNKKPSVDQLSDIDLMLFDMQSVGVRFYTYLSTLHLVMEACAENNIPLIILDRPNPNGHYIDGPVLDLNHSTFVGMHPIPIVYGMTLGEMAQMIVGEKWLDTAIALDLKVIPLANYHRQEGIELPFPPSPNLPNAQAVALYPSLCLLEPTKISIGRGTDKQFQIYGHPDFQSDFQFTPQPNEGSKYPKLEGKLCKGVNLQSESKPQKIRLEYLLQAYADSQNKEDFFLDSFERIAGNAELRKQIQQGTNAIQIRASWEPKLSQFKRKRKQYLIYPDE